MELLGTGDTIDPEIGGRVFKTRSSEDLAHLNRIVEWAKTSRLVRVSSTKLMTVKKNAALAERPLDLVLALLEAYPRLGKSLFPRNTWRQSLVDARPMSRSGVRAPGASGARGRPVA